MRSKRGATFVEVLVALTAPVILLGWTAQTVPPEPSALPLTPAQFLRSAADAVKCSDTPRILVVEASSSAFGFEVDCVPGSATGDRLASFDPSRHSSAARQGGEVDTVTFFFQPDSTTARTDDFALMRQVNDERPTAERRNMLVFPGRSFLHYFYRHTRSKSAPATHQMVPAEWLPMHHIAAEHGSAADTGINARIDTLYAVEVNFSVINSSDGVVTPSTSVIPLTSLRRDRLCGEDEPIFSHTSALPSFGVDPRARLPVQVCA